MPTSAVHGKALSVVQAASTITRPSDTTTYTAADAISDTTGNAHFTFTGPTSQPAKGGLIEAAMCINSAAVATAPDLELWLFSADIATVADNAAFTITDAEANTLVGVISFPTASFMKSALNQVCVQKNLGISFKADTLYGQLVVRNGYVPTASEVFKVVLSVMQ